MNNGVLSINPALIGDETIAIWLNDTLDREIGESLGAAENEDLFAAGSDTGESADQHAQNARLNREYAAILQKAKDQLSAYWAKKEDGENQNARRRPPENGTGANE